jgi:hypothetical protein
MPTNTTHDRAAFLRRVLLADALASAAMAALLLPAAGALAGPLGLPAGLLRGAGLLMLPWVALTAWLGTRAEPSRPPVWTVVAGNAVWAADSLLLLLSGWVAPTALGAAFVLAQAAAVAVLAVLQALGQQRLAEPAAA